MRNIHYLIKNITSEKGGLIYPNEIDSNLHYTIGNLYILGDEIKRKYTIHAVQDEVILRLTLKRVKADEFATTVDNIGKFTFYAERVSMQKYTGVTSNIKGATKQTSARFA